MLFYYDLINKNVLFVFTLNLLTSSCDVYMNYIFNRSSLSEGFKLFKSEESILGYYNDIKNTESEKIDILMSSYAKCYFTHDVEIPEGKRRPFILVEGDDRIYRRMVAKYLARSMRAKYLHTPPKCLTEHVRLFESGALSRNAFFSLCNYVSAFNARYTMNRDVPVVMNGYWFEQSSYILKMVAREMGLPPAGHYIYEPPSDLMMPDMIIYLHMGGYQKMLFKEIYTLFQEYVPVRIVDSGKDVKSIALEIKHMVTQCLSKNEFDFSPIDMNKLQHLYSFNY